MTFLDLFVDSFGSMMFSLENNLWQYDFDLRLWSVSGWNTLRYELSWNRLWTQTILRNQKKRVFNLLNFWIVNSVGMNHLRCRMSSWACTRPLEMFLIPHREAPTSTRCDSRHDRFTSIPFRLIAPLFSALCIRINYDDCHSLPSIRAPCPG